MVHRVFRLSISPERAPEVRRVVDFDGRCTLNDVHDVIQRELDLDDDHLFAFYLSGRYFDRATEYSLSRDAAHDSGTVLFRLGLEAGQQFAYLFDFGDEHRHAITVEAVTEVEAPLDEPVVVESVGEAPSQYGSDGDEEGEPYELPEHLEDVEPLAELVLTLSEQLDGRLEEDDAKHELQSDDEAANDAEPPAPPEAIVSLLRLLSKAALDLAAALEEDQEAVLELDEWSRDRELLARLVELPMLLCDVGDLDSALAVARAFSFAAAEPFNGHIAVILAESGKREEAIAQLESNLKQYPKSSLTAVKAGETYEALGDAAAAEASYRRALVVAEDGDSEELAFNQLVGLLEDLGRFEEVEELMSPSLDDEALKAPTPVASVGRNDPCPCGSGKKYKKCHGA